jgi:hypothetical protein
MLGVGCVLYLQPALFVSQFCSVASTTAQRNGHAATVVLFAATYVAESLSHLHYKCLPLVCWAAQPVTILQLLLTNYVLAWPCSTCLELQHCASFLNPAVAAAAAAGDCCLGSCVLNRKIIDSCSSSNLDCKHPGYAGKSRDTVPPRLLTNVGETSGALFLFFAQ